MAKLLGRLTRRREERGRTFERTDHELVGDVARESLVHTGLNQRLDDQVQIGGHGPGESGHGVDVALAHADDRANGSEDRLGPVEVILRDVRTPAMALTPFLTSTGVLGIERITAMGRGSVTSIRAVDRPATTDNSRVAPSAPAIRATASACSA